MRCFSFELDPTKKGTAYSKGNRQKVPLVAALASDVELLILDEPTIGLDPLMEEVFAECIQAERQRGRTVFLSSHILSEVEALCDRVSIIRTAAMSRPARSPRCATSSTRPSTWTPPASPALDGLPGIGAVEIDGNRLQGQVPTERIGALLTEPGPYGIIKLTCQPPTLEQLFLRHYDRNAAIAEPAPVSAGTASAGTARTASSTTS